MRNARRPVEKILVAKTDGSTGQAIVADGTTRFTNQSTFVTNLADGQLGVFDATGNGTNAINVAISPGDTVKESPEIVIAQGTPQSSSPSTISVQGFFPRTYEASRIAGKSVKVFRGKAYRAGTLNAWTIGADLGQSDAIVPLDETEFSLLITQKGRRKEFENSTRGRQGLSVNYVTPDYTTLGFSASASLDHLVQNLVVEINKHSTLHNTNNRKGKEDFVAFAVDTDATTATAGSTTIAGITAGTTSINGVIITAAMEAALDAIAADANVPDIDSSSRIVPTALTTAGTGVATTQAVVILSLDEATAFIDRVPQVKINLDLGLTAGFNYPTVLLKESQAADEGEGSGRFWKIYYEGTDGQRAYHTNRVEYPVIPQPQYVVETETYDAYIIEHGTNVETTLTEVSHNPMKTIILVPSSDTTTKNQLEAVLNPWIQSAANLPFVSI